MHGFGFCLSDLFKRKFKQCYNPNTLAGGWWVEACWANLRLRWINFTSRNSISPAALSMWTKISFPSFIHVFCFPTRLTGLCHRAAFVKLIPSVDSLPGKQIESNQPRILTQWRMLASADLTLKVPLIFLSALLIWKVSLSGVTHGFYGSTRSYQRGLLGLMAAPLRWLTPALYFSNEWPRARPDPVCPLLTLVSKLASFPLSILSTNNRLLHLLNVNM